MVTTLLGMATCACLFATVALNVLLAQGQVHVDRLDGRAAAERVRQETLRRQVAELEAPRRVVSVATKHLGMVPVDNVRYLRPPAVAFSVRAGSGVGTEQPRE